jgi:NADPH:quinone reductase-like Zn-dependent oxidoreductase
MRMQFGILEPKMKILGVDLAGEIEAVGKDVNDFRQANRSLEHLNPLWALMPSTSAYPKTGC